MRCRSIFVVAVVAAATLQALPAAGQLRVGGGGVEVSGGNNPAVAQTTSEPQIQPVRDMRRPGGQTLRCWQYGRLLYESSGFRGGLERSGNAVGVQRREGDPVVVLDLKQATCILSDN